MQISHSESGFNEGSTFIERRGSYLDQSLAALRGIRRVRQEARGVMADARLIEDGLLAPLEIETRLPAEAVADAFDEFGEHFTLVKEGLRKRKETSNGGEKPRLFDLAQSDELRKIIGEITDILEIEGTPQPEIASNVFELPRRSA